MRSLSPHFLNWRSSVIGRTPKAAVPLIAALVVGALSLSGCAPSAGSSTTSTADPSDAQTTSGSTSTQLAGDPALAAETLIIEDLTVGTGVEAKAGDAIAAHYTGWLPDGTMFDTSLDTGVPIEFTLGTGRVIAGWDQGIVGMKVGGTRKLIIPPSLAYGDAAVGKIPAGSTLIFEVELVEAR